MHTPIDRAAQADDRQDADIDALAEDRRGIGLVVGLVRDASRVVAVVIGLEHKPLVERIGALEEVVARLVGGGRGRAAVHERVPARSQRQAEVRDAGLAGILAPVPVGVVEDVALERRAPAGDRQDAHVDRLAAVHGHVGQLEDVVLGLVPVGQLVRAVGDVRDGEGPVAVATPHPDRGVAATEIGEHDPRLVDLVVDLGAGHPAAAVAGQIQAAGRRHIDVDGVDDALDRPMATGHELVGWVVPVRGRRTGDVPEDDGREGLAGDDELGVEAGRPLHHPGVPVVIALEGRRLDPAGPGRRHQGERVAVGPRFGSAGRRLHRSGTCCRSPGRSGGGRRRGRPVRCCRSHTSCTAGCRRRRS